MLPRAPNVLGPGQLGRVDVTDDWDDVQLGECE